MPIPELDPKIVHEMVMKALLEDVGSGDCTALLVPPGASSALLMTREPAVLCGCAWFEETFRQLDPLVNIVWYAADCDRIGAGDTICQLAGPARALLTGERTAINFLQTLSATATATRRYADLIAHTRAQVLDTRKTLPGWRLAQKYAVRCGGGTNHRLGLYDGILIKENHIIAAGSIATALQKAQAVAQGRMIEIEVETLAQLEEAVTAGATRILLDNFSLDTLHEAVRLNAGRARLEASGGISTETITAMAETGVDFLSVGDITKNIRAIDLSLRFTQGTNRT